VAYRSRSRPSSTLGAKASTMCPYYLDGDQVRHAARADPVIPVFQPPLILAADVASVQFSRTAKRRVRRLIVRRRACRAHGFDQRTPVSQNSTACWTV
jgi:hypothetical protein